MKSIISNKIINFSFIYTVMIKTLNVHMKHWATPPVKMNRKNINITTSTLKSGELKNYLLLIK